jgi:hypothetical protein
MVKAIPLALFLHKLCYGVALCTEKIYIYYVLMFKKEDGREKIFQNSF